MEGRAGLSREERLNRVISLWSRALSECVVSVVGKKAPYIWKEVGRVAVERLREEGVEFFRDDPVDTINSIYSYFTDNGYFKEARAQRTGSGPDTIEIYEKWSVDFDRCCYPPYEDDLSAHACFCHHIIRYALNSKFSLDLKFLSTDTREEAGEVFIKALLVQASDRVLESTRLLNELNRFEKSVEDFSRAIDMSLDGIVSADESGRVILWNLAAERIMGYSQKEAMGLPIETIVPPEYRERHREGFKRFVSTGHGALIGKVTEFEGLRKDGTRFPLEMSLTAEKSDGRWVFTSVIRDISYRKNLEDRLREKLCEMERLNKLMVGRELKMEELRAEIRTLRSKVAVQNG
ncbi:MAG: PAS domain S-box protein [Deltaproteobacteria bacterium]|nr:PAS domain S-box protein [Deltaproteobacteria bacterium]